jgi:hypothetical protein
VTTAAFLLAFAACKNGGSTVRESELHTDVDGLLRHISLPHQPERVLWRMRTLGEASSLVPGPTDYKLVAVITFTSTDAKAILESAPVLDRPDDDLPSEPWFPDAVRRDLAKNPVRLDPKPFFRTPLNQGRLLHIRGTSIFVLSLFTT